jgi:flagellum-specific ATP synthase
MTQTDLLAPYFARLAGADGIRWSGWVRRVAGPLIESSGPYSAVGEVCELRSREGWAYAGEVVGFRDEIVLSMPLERTGGIHYGDRIHAWGERPSFCVGSGLLGRVIDGLGNPIDQHGPCRGDTYHLLEPPPPASMDRPLIHEALGCGIRAVDGFLTCGRGQRVGIFGGSGVGKSTLIGMMTRNTDADVVVLALIGERGREVRHFLEEVLGDQGRKRAVVVVSTSDQSPLLRIRGALAAATVAEYFCSQGRHVLLVLDSLTRLAMAQREISLAVGEPPTTKGYTPSVFSLMARLVERAGKFHMGSITAFYTVLMEGDDQQDPIVDGARALLDGHIVLDRKLAARNHYPPISILDSISRLMPDVCSGEHLEQARKLRQLLAVYSAAEDMIRLGAYQKGSDPNLDQAIALMPELDYFLEQGAREPASLSENFQRLMALSSGAGS